MVRISIEVSNGVARFSVSVQAESIERALEIVERQNPGNPHSAPPSHESR